MPGIFIFCFLTVFGPRCGPVYAAPVPIWQPAYQLEYQRQLLEYSPVIIVPGQGNAQPAAPVTNPCGWTFANGGWTPSGQCGNVIYFPPCQPNVCA